MHANVFTFHLKNDNLTLHSYTRICIFVLIVCNHYGGYCAVCTKTLKGFGQVKA